MMLATTIQELEGIKSTEINNIMGMSPVQNHELYVYRKYVCSLLSPTLNFNKDDNPCDVGTYV
jgi:hypothetical protein